MKDRLDHCYNGMAKPAEVAAASVLAADHRMLDMRQAEPNAEGGAMERLQVRLSVPMRTHRMALVELEQPEPMMDPAVFDAIQDRMLAGKSMAEAWREERGDQEVRGPKFPDGFVSLNSVRLCFDMASAAS